MESKTAKDIESEVCALMANDNVMDVEAIVESTGTSFDESDMIDAMNMSSRLYCQATESTRVGVVESISNGIAYIPMDNLRLKEAIVTDEVVHGAGNMPGSVFVPELSLRIVDPTTYTNGEVYKFLYKKFTCTVEIDTNIPSPSFTYLWEAFSGSSPNEESYIATLSTQASFEFPNNIKKRVICIRCKVTEASTNTTSSVFIVVNVTGEF